MAGASRIPSRYDTPDHSSAIVSRSSTDLPTPDLAKHLRKFTSAHSTLLGWAGFQALELKRMPSNIRKWALLIELSWRVATTPVVGAFPCKPACRAPIYIHLPFRQLRSLRHASASTLISLLRPCRLCRHTTPRRSFSPYRRHWRRCRVASVWTN